MTPEGARNDAEAGLLQPGSQQQTADEIIYRLSHDLRGSTRALSDLPTWIQEDLAEAGLELPDSVQDCLHLMQNHTQRLNKMIDGLLLHSRVGRSPAEVMDGGQAVRKVLTRRTLPDTARLRSKLQEGAVQISMPDLEMAVDVLISNALIHGSPDTRIAITGSIEQDSPETGLGDFWVLKVRDNGPGIPERHWTEVFKPMVSLHAASEDKGVGMGLAILDKIALHCGGRAWVARPSRDRQGASLCLALPLSDETQMQSPSRVRTH